jgi:crotonobetaine/carnitine-CoA ligase
MSDVPGALSNNAGDFHPDFRPYFRDKRDWQVGRVLEHWSHLYLDRPFICFSDGGYLSYGELNRRANLVAHGLEAAGIERGDRVILLLPNCIEYIATWIGMQKMGVVPVCLNTSARGRFFERPVNTSEARCLITDEALLSNVFESEAQLLHLESVFIREGDVDSHSNTRLRVRPYADLIATDDSNPPTITSYSEVGLLFLTGGTTGPSKLVEMPNAHVHWLAEQFAWAYRMTEFDTHFNAFPFFHGSGLINGVYACLIKGAKTVVYPSFSASQWLERIRKHRATTTQLLGVTMDYVFKQPPKPDDSDNDLRCVLAVPNAYRIRSEFMSRFGIEEVIEGWGSTEVCFPVLARYGEPRPPGSCGKLLGDWYDVRLVEPGTEEEIPCGEVGEALVRTKEPWTMTQGYAGQPEVTARVTRNLWWHTGDFLRRDETGWFYFVDRVDDAIRIRGENVSSYEVEEVILEHPKVAMCAVVGVQSEHEAGDQELKACVVPVAGGTLSPMDIVEHCIANAPWYAVPRYVEIRSDLPRNEHGKLLKHQLRQSTAVWDRVAEGVDVQR